MAPTRLLGHLSRSIGPHSYGELLQFASKRGVAGALRRGEVVRLLPDSYCAGVHAESWLARARAALNWAGPGAVLAGASALHAWGVGGAPETVELLVPAGRHLRPPAWLRVRETVRLPPHASWADAGAVSLPAAAVVHAHSWAPARARSEVVYVAMRSRLVSAREVLAAAETIPRVTDRRGLERRLALAARGAESFLEEHAMTRVLATKAFRGLVYQHTVRVGRARFRLDALDLSTLTAFECDGSAMHDTALAVARDKRRDALLASVGILTVRFTYSDIMNRPEWCRRVAARVMQSRS